MLGHLPPAGTMGRSHLEAERESAPPGAHGQGAACGGVGAHTHAG